MSNAPIRDESKQHVIYPNGYVWFVFVSALDIMLTWVILHVGGWEANALAAKIIYRWQLPGLVIYKFLLVTIVVLICEYVGRRNHEKGRLLLSIGIMLTCMPVVLALALMALHL